MKRFLFAAVVSFFICVSAAQAQLPSKQPLVAKEWEAHSHDLLIKLCHNAQCATAAKNIQIKVVESNNLSETGCSGKEMTIATATLRLIETEDELAGLLSHEIGHATLKHKPDSICFGMGCIIDTSLLRKQEIAADAFSVMLLRRNGYNPCARYSLFEREFRTLGFADQKKLDDVGKVHQERLRLLKLQCKSRK